MADTMRAPYFRTILLNEGAGWRRTRLLPGAGVGRKARRISRIVRSHGVSCELRIVRGARFEQAVREVAASGVERVIVAGGDGTVSAAAAALAGTGTQLAVLPMGTYNHFARDVGIPRSLAGAVRVALYGRSKVVDTAEVNGRVFVNNSSLGVYPLWVRNRRIQREILGRGKWRAFLQAFRTVLMRLPSFRVLIRVASRPMLALRASFVFVSNNEYGSGLFSLGKRSSLNSHHLALRLGRDSRRSGIFRWLFRLLTGKRGEAAEMDSMTAEELWVFTRKKRVHVALDGELFYLRQPLHYRIRSGSLNVMVPSKRRNI